MKEEKTLIAPALRFRILCVVGGALCAFGGLLLAETALRTRDRPRGEGMLTLFDPQRSSRHDDNLGYKAIPGELRARKTRGEEVLYDVVYSFDDSSRRITPLARSTKRTKFALFFGGSFALGEGVEAEQTMAAQFAEFASGYRPYNYGFFGYGPQQMLAGLQEKAFAGKVSESEGFAVYIFILDHIARATGAPEVSWRAAMPRFIFDGRGELIRKGFFDAPESLTERISRFFGDSRLVGALRGSTSPTYDQKQIELTARIIEESRKIYRRKFPKGEFYMLFTPGSRHPGLMARLAGTGVRFLDYSQLYPPGDARFILHKEDRHPSPQAYRVMAERLARDAGGWNSNEPER